MKNTKPNRDITADTEREKIFDVLKLYDATNKASWWTIASDLADMQAQALTKQKEEIVKQVITALTTDISNSEFIGDGRREWEVLPDRGVEPCLECSNGFNIRKLLSMFQNELK